LAIPVNEWLFCFTSESSGIARLRFAARILADLAHGPVGRAELLRRFPAKQRREAEANLQEIVALGLIEPSYKSERNLSKQSAEIFALDKVSGEALSRSLDRLTERFSSLGFSIVVASDWLDPRLGQLCKESMSEWVLVSLAGNETRIGPRFVPGSRPCYRCLEVRLREKEWLREQLPRGVPACPPDLRNVDAAASLAAYRLAAMARGAWQLPPGVIWRFDWTTLRERRDKVVTFPYCFFCGKPAALPSEFRLHNVRGDFSALRSATAQDVVKRLHPSVVGSITGIVRKLDLLTLGESAGAFCYQAYVTPAIAPRGLRAEGGIVRPEGCSGRGWTSAEAMAGCLAESVERYAVQFRGDERRSQASYRDIANLAVHPNSVQLFSDEQFRNRKALNLGSASTAWVPEPFDPVEKIEWREGWSLTARERRFVPMALCSTSYRPSAARPIGNCDTNGCAAAATREEAILHATLELIERDAVAIWWYNRVAPSELAWNRTPASNASRAAEWLETLGWKIRLADLTTDIGIPVVAAIGVDGGGDAIFGFGAHPSLPHAAVSAISELVQMSHRKVSQAGLVRFSTGRTAVRLGAESKRINLKSVQQECQFKIERAGYELIAVDMSRPEIPFSVQRVLIPGLRPWHPRFAPGRLFEVPVKMGWRSAPLRVRSMRQSGF
jgi:ribosomal protein S12 methylthiotransferase accessory factor